VAEAWGQFRNLEEGEHLPLEAVTCKLVKIITEDTSVCRHGIACFTAAHFL
jgi:hypothetical protein